MTTSQGAPVNYDETSTLNKRLIFNEYFMESITHLNRERLPPRIVHAKGSGAFGYFEVTHDVTDICKAKLFSEVGKRTPIAIRFSSIFEEKGGVDTRRTGRGFAVKFYTEDGNFDIVGLNTPIFIGRDPVFFQPFVHTRKRNPQTNMFDFNMFWDFMALRPESIFVHLHSFFSDASLPDGYRGIPGFGVHTYQVVNEHGESHFVRFYFIPDTESKYLENSEGLRLSALDPDYFTRDLFNAIETGNFPSWTVSVQALSISDVKNATMDVFDVSKFLPEDQYPLRPIGKFVLNKNPVNYFAEIEQLALCPGNLVPGILGAPDKVFEARRLAYRDAQLYRLGGNFQKIKVNRPIDETLSYNRDGRPPVGHNQGNLPNYYPNSYNGPVPYMDKHKVDLINIYEGPADNFGQVRKFYNELSPGERSRLINNVVDSLRRVTDKFLQDRTIKIFKKIDMDFGNRVWEGLQVNRTIELNGNKLFP